MQTNIYSRFFFPGDFLPPQIIYGGKTEKCHPVYKCRQHFNNEYFLIKICICGRNLRFNASLSVRQIFFLHHLASAKFKNTKIFRIPFRLKIAKFYTRENNPPYGILSGFCFLVAYRQLECSLLETNDGKAHIAFGKVS